MKLKIMTIAAALVAGSVSATLMTEYNNFFSAGKTNLTVDMGTSIAADAGDVIVFSASSSKSYVKGYGITSGDGGTVGTETGLWLDKNVSVSYFKVTTGGTFDLSIAGNDQTFDSFGAYVLGSDQVGYSVAELASATAYVGANVSVTNTLDYGTLASSGIVIEGAQSASFVSFPAGLTVNINSGNSRLSAYGDVTAGALTSQYISSNITKNQRAAGYVFAEVIPEPATLGMISIAGILLFIRRRFNRS